MTSQKSSTATAPTASTAKTGPTIIPASAIGRGGRPAPSERIVIGAIGGGAKKGATIGTTNINCFLNQPDAQVAAVCGVDREHLEHSKQVVDEFYASHSDRKGFPGGCAAYRDFRDLIARPDIDALCISLPDHWHSIPVIMGAKAGKHMYAEKPLALTIPEGRAMVEAVKRYGVTFQTGTQLRAIDSIRYGCELVRNGRIGKVHTVRMTFASAPACEPQDEMPIPDGFDYDMWLGPAPMAPYTKMRCDGNFRWIEDYSGGQVTDHGAHYVDIAQWGLGTELTGPAEVEGVGSFPEKGLFNVATSFDITWTYPDGTRLIGMNKAEDLGIVCAKFYGAEGWLYVGPDNKLDAEPKSILDSVIGENEIHLHRCPGGHHRDFLDSIRSGLPPVAPIEPAHSAAAVCHIGNIAMKCRRKLQWDPVTERFPGDDEANAMLSRPMRAPWKLPEID